MKADIWTNINFYGNLLIKPLINTVGIALMLENLSGDSGKQQGWDDFSYNSLGIGLGWAILCAVGESFSHRSLNTHNQTATSDTEMTPLKLLEDSKLESDSIEEDAKIESTDRIKTKRCCPIKTKYLLLGGDWLAHTTDTIGPLTLAFHFLKPGALSNTWNITVQIGILILAALSSYTEVRTCQHNLDEDDQDHQLDNSYSLQIETPNTHSQSGADIWVKINFPIEMLTIFLNNLVLVGALIDNSSKDVEISELSAPALLTGTGWGLVISISTAFCHYMLNSNHQSHHHMLTSRDTGGVELKWHHKLQQQLDRISHTIDRASPLGSVIRILVPREYSIAENLGVMLFTGVISAPIAYADSRTCGENVKKYQARM